MSNTITIEQNSISTQDLHQLLLTAIAPRPIAFASTVDIEGKNMAHYYTLNLIKTSKGT